MGITDLALWQASSVKEELTENKSAIFFILLFDDQFLLNSNILLENNTSYHKVIPLLKKLQWFPTKHRIKSELLHKPYPPSVTTLSLAHYIHATLMIPVSQAHQPPSSFPT